MADGLNEWWTFFGKTHPAVAHFPIALLLIALVAEIIARWGKNPAFHSTAKLCLFIGTVAAVITSISGFPLTTLIFQSYSSPTLQLHKILALIVSSLAVVACAISFTPHQKTGILKHVYFLLLLLIAVLILVVCHTGGQLVYGDDFFAFPSTP
jgi:uncharacterized membrane protein